MPFEEQGKVKEITRKHGMEVITLVAPTSESRIEEIARHAEGFVYLVSSMGVTGVRNEITTDLSSIVTRIRKYADIPIAIGFGILTPEQAVYYLNIANGAIVGSAIVNIIADHNIYNSRNSNEFLDIPVPKTIALSTIVEIQMSF